MAVGRRETLHGRLLVAHAVGGGRRAHPRKRTTCRGDRPEDRLQARQAGGMDLVVIRVAYRGETATHRRSCGRAGSQ